MVPLVPAGPAERRSESALDGRLEVGVGYGLTGEVLAVTLGGAGDFHGSRTQGDDDVSALSSLGLHGVGVVIGVIAGELSAAGDRRLGVGRVHLVDVGGVVRVHNGRDVKVGGAGVAVPGELSQHTWHIVTTVRIGIVVANPVLRDSDSDVLTGGDRGVFDVLQAGVGSPDDGTVGVIHGHEGDQVLCAHQGGAGQGGNHLVLHLG